MVRTTPMGPGFFILFQRGGPETTEPPKTGGYIQKDHPYLRTPKYKPVNEEEEKAAQIIEDIAIKVEATPYIETNQDIELMLMLKLESQGLMYKSLYLNWVINEIELQKRRNKSIALLLLH